MTRLLLILLAASFALPVLAVVADDTVAERRATVPEAPQNDAATPSVPRRAAPATAGAREPVVST